MEHLAYVIAAVLALIAAALAVAYCRLRRDHSIILRKCDDAERREIAAADELVKTYGDLARHRTLLQAVTNHIPDQIYFKDLDGRFVLANPPVIRNLGAKSASEVLGKSDFDFFRPELALPRREDEERIMATGVPMLDKLENAGTDPSEQRWLSTTKAPVLDETGQVIGIIGVNRDITERVRADEILRRDRARLRNIYDHSPVMMVTFDEQNICRHVNNCFLEQTGYAAEDVIGQPIWFLMTSESAERAQNELLPRCWQDGKLRDASSQFIRKDGLRLDVLIDCSVTSDDEGRRHSLAVVRDVTEMNRAKTMLENVVSRANCILWRAEVSNKPDGTFDWRMRFFTSDANRRWLGLDAVSENVDVWHAHVLPEYHEMCDRNSRTALRSGLEGYSQEFQMRGTDNTLHWMFESVAINAVDNNSWVLVGVVLDITARKRTEQELAHERDLMQVLMDNVPDCIFFKDVLSRFIRVNRHEARILGLDDPTDIVGKTDFDFYPAERAREFYADERQIVEKGLRVVGKVERQSTSEDRWTLTTKVPFFDREGRIIGIVGTSKDITEMKRMEQQLAQANEQLNRLAREDALTGLLNRRVLLQIAETEWARWLRYQTAFSFMILDVDDFKLVNDRHGHLVGDRVLRALANSLRQSLRAVDTIGRYGGEEFVVIMPETSLDGGVAAGQKVLQNVKALALDGVDGPFHISVSIGVAEATKADGSLDILLQRADEMLLLAKRSGKSRVVAYHPTEHV